MTGFRRFRLTRQLLDAAELRVLPLAGLAIASAVQALLIAPAPFIVKRAFELVTSGGAWTSLTWTIAGLVALLLASEAIGMGVKVAALRVTKPAVLRLRAHLASAIAHLPVDLVEPQSPYLHDVYVHDTDRVDVMLSSAIGQALPAMFLVIGLASALAVAHPAFGLATTVGAIVVASVERLMRRANRRRLDAAHRAFGEFSRGGWSMLAGLAVTRSHAGEARDAAARQDEAARAAAASAASGRTAALSSGIGRATAAVVFGGLLLAAGLLVEQRSMSIPSMLAIYSTIALLRGPLFTLGQIAPQTQEGWRAWGRVNAVLEAASRTPRRGGIVPPADAALVLADVGCRYGRHPLFEGVSFELRPGEVVALTGPNGAGKTTLVRQIVGLSSPTSGAIRVGGVAMDEIDLAAWRQSIGVVLQQTWFFDGTVFENLTYGAPAATRADVEEACRLAQAETLVQDLPEGLETRIGTDGLRLSEGQRQRLAIARALVRRPRLLILDEPTSHLDEASARALIRTLVDRPGRPAVLLVTHQPEFAATADRVYRLADGRFELLAKAQAFPPA